MKYISDQLLFEAYDQAVKLRLKNEFISLLKSEMQRRNIDVNNDHETPLYSSKSPQDYRHKNTKSGSKDEIIQFQ